jgi:DNA polymerase-3 subunit delta'
VIRFDEVLGQRAAIELLVRMLDSGRIPQALLFQGPEGVGKGSIARSFAAALLCAASRPEACGSCAACRLIEGGAHPDLLLVERLPRKLPAETRGGAPPVASRELRSFVLVDQIRELSRVAALAPRQSARRVIVIDPADRMNHEAQNALLKTLEEPPPRCVLILVAARHQLLLPTVRSRCFAVGFGPLRTGELAGLLQARGIPEQEAVARAALAAGRPGRALGLDLEELLARRESVLEALEALTASPPAAAAAVPALAAELAGRDETTLLGGLDLLEALLRDAALSAAGAERRALAHSDLADRLNPIGRKLTPSRIALLLPLVERLRHDLRLNLNRALVAETVLAAVAGGPLL